MSMYVGGRISMYVGSRMSMYDGVGVGLERNTYRL